MNNMLPAEQWMRAAALAVCGFAQVAVMSSALAQTTSAPLLIDTHIHYSHDAWELLPPPKALEVLRAAGLKRAFVSSSSDQGTQKLYALAPDFIVPVLRPYRARGEISSWANDESVIPMLTQLLQTNRYAGIGEFHAYDADIELPVLQAVIELAQQHKIFLHAHSDADAVKRIFAKNAEAIVLWAHSGFDDPGVIREMLKNYPNLWSDLAFRSEHHNGAVVAPEWRSLFVDFPTRFVLGTDTFAPERWHYVQDNANENRAWLAKLPGSLAVRIASQNALDLLARTSFR
jgi:hypothetical protein